jgi:hypothetical protein
MRSDETLSGIVSKALSVAPNYADTLRREEIFQIGGWVFRN